MKLWNHQDEYVTEHSEDPEYILLWEPRMGKTRAITNGLVKPILEHNVFRILVVGPKTGCKEVWVPELTAFFEQLESPLKHEIVELFDGPLSDRHVKLVSLVTARQQRVYSGQEPKIEVVIVNRDALNPLLKSILAWNPQYFVIDELHKFKHSGSMRSRAAFAIGKVCKYRRGLTGTPAARSFEDIFGQWKVIAPRIFGTNKAGFVNRYCVFAPGQWQTKPVGYVHVPELREKAFSIASIKFRAECMDIPDTVPPQIIDVVMPKEARKIYDNIVKEHILELDGANVQIPMTHTLSRMTQLRQIAIGYARHGEEDRSTHWLHMEKIKTTTEQIEQIVGEGGKVAVFHCFEPEGLLLHSHLKLISNIDSGRVYGGQTSKKRSEVLSRFRETDDAPVIIVQEETASESISLTAGRYIIFLSHGMSADTHKQASDRTFQEQNEEKSIKLFHIYPRVVNTVERSIYRMVKDKLSMENALLVGGRISSRNFKDLAYGETSFISHEAMLGQ